MNFSMESLQQKLSQVTYDPSLGIKDVVLAEVSIQGKVLQQRMLMLEAGKELKPHLHEEDDEIGMVLSTGIVYLGDGEKDGEGNYLLDSQGNVVVKWEEPKQYSSGETFTILAGKAHHFVSGATEPFALILTLPKTHINGEDRKFTTHP